MKEKTSGKRKGKKYLDISPVQVDVTLDGVVELVGGGKNILDFSDDVRETYVFSAVMLTDLDRNKVLEAEGGLRDHGDRCGDGATSWLERDVEHALGRAEGIAESAR